ncbi:hypothetical protein AMTR_s00103p00071300 [Amborella trichopoda]|uniref:Uncharacterized protein n=1 Tax=Amborella trichopoda TaxID=13333 RepID=W1P1K8_AMBTC|nr:hypothetical protein AMTR_s00103p00071300 [Amborella trichopoda]
MKVPCFYRRVYSNNMKKQRSILFSDNIERGGIIGFHPSYPRVLYQGISIRISFSTTFHHFRNKFPFLQNHVLLNLLNHHNSHRIDIRKIKGRPMRRVTLPGCTTVHQMIHLS